MPADLEEVFKEVKKITPVTKFACASTLGLTLLVATKPFQYHRAMTYGYHAVFQQYQVSHNSTDREPTLIPADMETVHQLLCWKYANLFVRWHVSAQLTMPTAPNINLFYEVAIL